MQHQCFADHIAALAVEVHLAVGNLEEMAFSVMVQSMLAHDEARRVELLAARIGLPPASAAVVLANKQMHAERLGRAAALLKSLIPHADEVLALSERPALRTINGGRS